MTREEFKSLLIRLNPNNVAALDGVTLPLVASFTAQHCFTNNMVENDDTRELRRQLKHLESPGYFDFEKD